MRLHTKPRPTTLTARESEARAALRRLRACSREIERLAARSSAARHHSGTELLDDRLHALTAEADHIRLELANWDVAGSPLWTKHLQLRLERLASAIAAAGEHDLSPRQRDRVVVWPGRESQRRSQTADEVERTVYDRLYPRPGTAAALG